MDITYTGAAASARASVQNTDSHRVKATRASPRSLRLGTPKSLLEVRAFHLSARRRPAAWRSLRAEGIRLDRIELEVTKPCEEIATMQVCDQVGVCRHAAPRLHEEGGDE
jgi:hypothetical protein